MRRNGQTGRAGARAGGFTLVEILSAMALSVFIMIGLAQVFKMSSDAVEVAEGTSDAYQQGRGALSSLERDFAQQTSDGYLMVVANDLASSTTFSSGHSWVTKPWVNYRFDTLIFTAVGQFDEMGDHGVGIGAGLPPQTAGAAEVVYSYGIRTAAIGNTGSAVALPYETFGVSGEDDPRTMLLVRKPYLVSPAATGQPFAPTEFTSMSMCFQKTGSGTDGQGAGGKTGIQKRYSCLPLMMADRWLDMTTSSYYGGRYHVMPTPYTTGNPPNAKGFTTTFATQVNTTQDASTQYINYDADASWVVADRCSEFFVEVCNTNGVSGKYNWYRPDQNTLGSQKAVWAGNSPNPYISTISRNMPTLVRVTLVTNPHNDTAKLSSEEYGGEIPTTTMGTATVVPKYRGKVFREVFRLKGTLEY